MAASHQPTFEPSIVLLEEYNALAAAISLALKKFAPSHATSVASSIGEAETLAGRTKPDLFIIDFEPSYAGSAEFIQKIAKAHPEARVLILAGDVPDEIASERREFGVLQFIKKPYDLVDLGAAVQTLLGPWSAPQSRRILRRLALTDIVTLQCAGRRSIMLDAKGTGGKTGAIHIVDGKIFHAETDEQEGAKALTEMFSWASPRFRVTEKRVPSPRTIRKPWPATLLQALEGARQPEKKPAEKPLPKTGKKIVIVDDTEMLLVFTEEVLSGADSQLQITKATTGTEGIKQIESMLPDLVLLDYNLPDLNGGEVCRRLLQKQQTSRIPVLMMSGHIAEMTAAARRFANIVATLEKPFLSDALVAHVRRALAAGPRVTPAPAASGPKAPPPKTVGITVPETESPSPKEEAPAREPEQSLIPKALDRKPLLQEAAPPVSVEPHAKVPQAEPGKAITRAPTISGPVPSLGRTEVVLGLFLKVMSMQLTPQLRLGAIRATPVSFTVSLHFPAGTSPEAIPLETGFQLGTTQLDDKGRISALRLIPSTKPFQPEQIRNEFEIGGVALVPNETRARVQLTPAGTTPMTMELFARMDMAAVELSSTFKVAQLTLKWRTTAVRVILNPKAPEQSGASFEAAAVKLDKFGRIAEVLLNPIK